MVAHKGVAHPTKRRRYGLTGRGAAYSKLLKRNHIMRDRPKTTLFLIAASFALLVTCCSDEEVVCSATSDCDEGYTCDVPTGQCVAQQEEEECSADEQCDASAGEYCIDSECRIPSACNDGLNAAQQTAFCSGGMATPVCGEDGMCRNYSDCTEAQSAGATESYCRDQIAGAPSDASFSCDDSGQCAVDTMMTTYDSCAEAEQAGQINAYCTPLLPDAGQDAAFMCDAQGACAVVSGCVDETECDSVAGEYCLAGECRVPSGCNDGLSESQQTDYCDDSAAPVCGEDGACRGYLSCAEVQTSSELQAYCMAQTPGAPADALFRCDSNEMCDEIERSDTIEFVRITDTTPFSAQACEQTDGTNGADLLDAFLVDTDGFVLGWALVWSLDLGPDSLFSTAESFDGAPNFTSGGTLMCPDRFTTASPAGVSLGCGGSMVLSFVDSNGQAIREQLRI